MHHPWQAKHEALEAKQQHVQHRFLEALNSLDVARQRMRAAVPNAVHAALRDRYTALLAHTGRLAAQHQRMCRLLDVPAAAKQLPPDDWRRYEEDAEGGLPDAGGGGEDGDGDGPDLDEAEEGLPHDFAESVRTHRERLIASYRNYRRYPAERGP